MSKYLIVNADDFGVAASVNEAIEECLLQGRITSTSVLVNAPSSRPALEFAGRHADVSIGLHLNLTHFAPLAPDSALAPQGRFMGMAALAKAQLSAPRAFQQACKVEFLSQLRAFTELSGRSPSHIDTHLWIQFLPGVFAAMLEVAGEHGIPAVRMVDRVGQPRAGLGAIRIGGRRSGSLRRLSYQGAKVVLIESLARAFRHRRQLDSARLFGPSIHAGVVEGLLYYDVGTRLQVYEHIVSTMPTGCVVELVVHPGGQATVPGMHYDARDAAVERAALMSDEWPAMLVRHTTQLLRQFAPIPGLG